MVKMRFNILFAFMDAAPSGSTVDSLSFEAEMGGRKKETGAPHPESYNVATMWLVKNLSVMAS
jgi:hypothetical protein